MRLFKPSTVNWKYIVGEILLIFFGISLAIWFNNWNASNTVNENKRIAIDKIEEEIQNNLKELHKAREVNLKIPKAIEAYEEMVPESYGQAVSSISKMKDFQENFPEFFIIKDSVQINDSLYRYLGSNRIKLELLSLSQIAWETSRNMGITNEFGYECLYSLENMHNIQLLVQNEINKAAEALQNGELERLKRILGTVNQLDVQLEEAYTLMLKNIADCI